MTDPSPQHEGHWESPKGPVTKVVAWIILICLALVLAGMIAVVLFH